MQGVRGLLKTNRAAPKTGNERDDKEKQAKDSFEKAKSLIKKDSTTHDYETAIAYLTAAVELSPATGQYYYLRATCYSKLAEYKLALFDYTMAIQIEEPQQDKKKVASYYGSRGHCFRQKGKLEDSIADFKKAKKLDPDNGAWYLEMGISFYDLGDKQRALEMFNIALSENKGNPQKQLTKYVRTKTHVYRGNTRRELGDIEGSIEDLKIAVDAEDNANNRNILGLSYFDQADYRQAAQNFQRACEVDATNAVYFNNLGLAHFQLQKYEESLHNFHDAQSKDPENANIYFNRGNAELVLRMYEEALADFDEAIARLPDDENVFHSKGIVFQEMKQIQNAIEQFHKALELNPSFKPSLFHLGLMYHISSPPQLFLAIECFSKVLKLDPTDRRAYESIGLVYSDLMYFDLAVGAFTKAIQLLPANGVNYFYKGKALLWLGRYDEAIQSLEEALKLGCQEAQVFNCRAMALKHIGLFHKAIEDLGEAIERDPRNVEYWYHRSQCYIDVKEYHSAARDLTEAIASDPTESKLYYLRGKAQYPLGWYDKTIADLKKALELDANAPDAHDCYFSMGIALANSGRHAEALECFTNAVALKPNTAVYLHERAKSLQCEGKYEEAVVDFTKVISLQPLNAHAYFRRAFALKSIRRFDDAAADFEFAKKLQPDNPHLVVNYKRVYDVEYIELCRAGEEPQYESFAQHKAK